MLQAEIQRGYMTDIHTHIIYDVDDGAFSFEEAVAMLNEEERLGVDKVYLTPHFIHGKSNYNTDELNEKLQKLQKETSIKLLLGNELLYSPFIIDDLKKGIANTMGDTNYVLVEFNYHASADAIYEGCRSLYNAGYVVILAHIERYNCFSKSLAERLKNIDVLFQMNYGFYEKVLSSPLIYSFYKKMLKNGDISFIASDAHNMNHRKPNLNKTKLEKYTFLQEIGRE